MYLCGRWEIDRLTKISMDLQDELEEKYQELERLVNESDEPRKKQEFERLAKLKEELEMEIMGKKMDKLLEKKQEFERLTERKEDVEKKCPVVESILKKKRKRDKEMACFLTHKRQLQPRG